MSGSRITVHDEEEEVPPRTLFGDKMLLMTFEYVIAYDRMMG